MKFGILFSFFLSTSICLNAQNNAAQNLLNQVSENSLKVIENKIAGQQFEGRMAASKGDSLAIQFISNWFRTYRLSKSYKTTNSYLQNVPLTHSDYSKSALSIDGKEFELNKQWTYIDGRNIIGPSTAEVIFIGFGISTPSFDEFKNIDIEGKFVLKQWGFPKDNAGKSLIAEKDLPNYDNYVKSLANRKPLAVLLYAPDFRDEYNDLSYARIYAPYYVFDNDNYPYDALISSDIGNQLIGGNIDSVYSLISTSGKPYSFNTHKQLSLSIDKTVETTSSQNIIGLVTGKDTSLPCIVFTAHHDHEGKINGKTYYGADDNGSGTTALLEIVRILGTAAKKGLQPKRTIVFVSTAAEEQGLIGGHYYVDNPIIQLSKTYCNINIDMLGRIDSFYIDKKSDSNYVYCMYNDTTNKVFTSSKLNSLNKTCCRLILDTLYDNESKILNPYSLIARSDNFPFMQKGIPAIWFFSGFHKDYHQPSDTPDKINYPVFKRRTQFVLATLWRLANE